MYSVAMLSKGSLLKISRVRVGRLYEIMQNLSFNLPLDCRLERGHCPCGRGYQWLSVLHLSVTLKRDYR